MCKNTRKKFLQKGQVLEINIPIGPYDGEASGISVATSSIRFKNNILNIVLDPF